MKTIEEAFPDLKYGIYGIENCPSYDDLLESAGPKILISVSDRDYQGSNYVLVQEGGRYGYLTYGWGSCPGCDALQAASSPQDLEEIRQGLCQNVDWYDSPEAAMRAIEQDDSGDDWQAEERADFRKRARVALGLGEPTGAA